MVRYGTVEHSLEFTLVFKHLYRWLKAFGFASFNNSLLYFLDFADQTTFLCYCNITDILTIIIYLHYFLSVRSLDITLTIYIFCLYAKNFKLATIPAKKTFLYKHPTLCFKKLKKKLKKFLVMYARLIILPTIFNKINLCSKLWLKRHSCHEKNGVQINGFLGRKIFNINSPDYKQIYCHLPRIPLFGMNIAYAQ